MFLNSFRSISFIFCIYRARNAQRSLVSCECGDYDTGSVHHSFRMFVVCAVHIQCSKLSKCLECVVLSMVLCTMENPWSRSKRVGHSPDFGLPFVTILPWLCRKRRKAIFIHSFTRSLTTTTTTACLCFLSKPRRYRNVPLVLICALLSSCLCCKPLCQYWKLTICLYLATNMSGWHNVGLMLVHRLRRCPNIKPTLCQCLMFSRNCQKRHHILWRAYSCVNNLL